MTTASENLGKYDGKGTREGRRREKERGRERENVGETERKRTNETANVGRWSQAGRAQVGEERTGKKRQGKPEKTSNDSKKLLLTIFDFLVRRNRSWKRPTRRRYASCIYRRAIHLYSSLPTLRQLSVFFLSTTTPSPNYSFSLSLSLSVDLSYSPFFLSPQPSPPSAYAPCARLLKLSLLSSFLLV